ncbi:MAG TPA: hypothetical protein VLL27_11545, partial [Solirubrobacterales bacterium]|nr:hypothetical protein [Solirubrobacterales bacterium]
CAVGPTTVKVVGSVLGVPDGATTNTTHATVTEEKTLRLGSALGPVAGIAGTLTFIARDKKLHEEGKENAFTPLSATT